MYIKNISDNQLERVRTALEQRDFSGLMNWKERVLYMRVAISKGYFEDVKKLSEQARAVVSSNDVKYQQMVIQQFGD